MGEVARGEEGPSNSNAWNNNDATGNWEDIPDNLGRDNTNERTALPARTALPPQTASFFSATGGQLRLPPPLPTSQRTTTINTALGQIVVPEEDAELHRPRRGQPSPHETELVSQITAAGITIPYRRDEEIPWRIRGVIEDLLFKLEQKSSETLYLQKKVEGLNREVRIRKRDESADEERRPIKRREPSRGDDLTHTSSPNTENTSFGRQTRDPSRVTADNTRIPHSSPWTPPAGPVNWTLAPSRDSAATHRGHLPVANYPRREQRRGRPEQAPKAPADRPEPITINGRTYEPAVKVLPPGALRPEPHLLQRDIQRTNPPPGGDNEERGNDDPYAGFMDDSSEDDDDAVEDPANHDDNSLAYDFVIPPFWGAVRVNDFNGVPGQEGFERDNSFRNMLSGGAYYSRRTNTVYVGQSAREAREHDSKEDWEKKFDVFQSCSNHQAYVRARRGVPLEPQEVKKVRTVVNGGRRFTDRVRVEAWLLLRELYNIASRVLPEHRDAAMRFIMEPNKFTLEAPEFFPHNALRRADGPLDRMPPPRAIVAPPLEEAMNLDDAGLHLLYHHRPGSTNPIMGLAIDYAFRVGRRSVFGHSLSRLLAPVEREAMHAFRRQFAMLVSLPRRYREAIVDHDRANPQTPFTPQGGPTFTISRARIEPSNAPNTSIQDVIHALLDNRIPPEWVDHSYAFGIIFMNAHYNGAPIHRELFDFIDNERIARIQRYGIPAAITAWGGWRNPGGDEVEVVHAHMHQDDARPPTRGRRDDPEPRRGFTAPNWLLIGQDGMVEYLTHRPQSAARDYAATHTIELPSYAELDTQPLAGPSSSGNPLSEPATSDVAMSANVDNEPVGGAQDSVPLTASAADLNLTALTLTGQPEPTYMTLTLTGRPRTSDLDVPGVDDDAAMGPAPDSPT